MSIKDVDYSIEQQKVLLDIACLKLKKFIDKGFEPKDHKYYEKLWQDFAEQKRKERVLKH